MILLKPTIHKVVLYISTSSCWNVYLCFYAHKHGRKSWS